MAKAQLAREKAKASEIQVDQCAIIAEEKQEDYYKKTMPTIMDVRFQSNTNRKEEWLRTQTESNQYLI